MKHAMIDLECLGNGTNGLIVSIGAAEFEPGGDDLADPGRTFKANLTIQSGLNAGAVVEGRTIVWWLQQDDAARKALTDPGPVPEREALAALRAWLTKCGVEFVWGHGVNYDLRILAQAYLRYKQQIPWPWRNERDTRTLFDVAGVTPEDWAAVEARIPAGVKHEPVFDAVKQVGVVQRCYNRLKACPA